MLHMTGKSELIFSYSSSSSDPLLHSCPPPPHLVPVPLQALLLQVHPIHAHRRLHDSCKGYAQRSTACQHHRFYQFDITVISFHEATPPSPQSTEAFSTLLVLCTFSCCRSAVLLSAVECQNRFKSQFCKG